MMDVPSRPDALPETSRSAVTERVSVPFNDVAYQWREIAEEARLDIEDVFTRSLFCLGPHVEAFERDVARYLGVPHAIGVNSGTSALHLAMIASGIGPGDDVLVPSHTFIATIWGILYVGANPILCDVDFGAGTIDVADAARRITPNTKAIIPVHLYGQCADMDRVLSFAEQRGLIVVEDVAQAIGARWNGACAGTLGRFGCFSFYPGKILGAAGEAGLVTTSDDAAAARIRALRNHGQSERYRHEEIGYNYRMEGLQGVVLNHKLRHLAPQIVRRKEIAQHFTQSLQGLPLTLPRIEHQDHVWHLYVVRTPRRDALRAHLQADGIESGLHYPIPNHRQPCLAHLPLDRESFPQTDRWASECLSLPLYHGMENEKVEAVIDSVRRFFA